MNGNQHFPLHLRYCSHFIGKFQKTHSTKLSTVYYGFNYNVLKKLNTISSFSVSTRSPSAPAPRSRASSSQASSRVPVHRKDTYELFWAR